MTIVSFVGRFLQNWLFDGDFRESYAEFGIAADPTCVHREDVSYWTHGFYLTPLEVQGAGADFLMDTQKKVLDTGKSLALLKRICPSHHLVGKFRLATAILFFKTTYSRTPITVRLCIFMVARLAFSRPKITIGFLKNQLGSKFVRIY